MYLTLNERKRIIEIFRMGIYLILTAGFTYFLHLLAYIYHKETFVEFGIVENLQLVILILSTFLLAGEGIYFKKI